MPALDPITGGEELANTIAGVIGKFIPDKQAQAQAQIEMLRVLQQSDAAQAQTNTAEATSGQFYQAGWRPFIGWICGFVLALVYIPKALAVIAVWVYVCVKGGQFAPPPSLDLTDVMGLLGSMLGIGTMRTFEKTKGVA